LGNNELIISSQPASNKQTENKIENLGNSNLVIPKNKKKFKNITKSSVVRRRGSRKGTKKIRHIRPSYEYLLQDECINKKVLYLRHNWKDALTSDYRLLKFDDTNDCSIKLLKIILRDYSKNINSNVSVKELLIKAYTEYIDEYQNEIKKLWTRQDKNKESNLLSNGNTVSEIILSDSYKISDIDIIVISLYYKIPIVIFYMSRKQGKSSGYKFNVGHYNSKNTYFVKHTQQHTYYLLTGEEHLLYQLNNLDSKYAFKEMLKETGENETIHDKFKKLYY
jgi:hypothetical protein